MTSKLKFDYKIAENLCRSNDDSRKFVNDAKCFYDHMNSFIRQNEDLRRELLLREQEIEILKESLLEFESIERD